MQDPSELFGGRALGPFGCRLRGMCRIRDAGNWTSATSWRSAPFWKRGPQVVWGGGSHSDAVDRELSPHHAVGASARWGPRRIVGSALRRFVGRRFVLSGRRSRWLPSDAPRLNPRPLGVHREHVKDFAVRWRLFRVRSSSCSVFVENPARCRSCPREPIERSAACASLRMTCPETSGGDARRAMARARVL